jgi:hypothetical protein
LVSYEPPSFTTLSVNRGWRVGAWEDGELDAETMDNFAGSWQGQRLAGGGSLSMTLCFSLGPAPRPTLSPCPVPYIAGTVSGDRFLVELDGGVRWTGDWQVWLRVGGAVSSDFSSVSGVGVAVTVVQVGCNELEVLIEVQNTNTEVTTFDLAVGASTPLGPGTPRTVVGRSALYFPGAEFGLETVVPNAFSGMWGGDSYALSDVTAFRNLSDERIMSGAAWSGSYVGQSIEAGEKKTFRLRFWNLPSASVSASPMATPTPHASECPWPYVTPAAANQRMYNVDAFTRKSDSRLTTYQSQGWTMYLRYGDSTTLSSTNVTWHEGVYVNVTYEDSCQDFKVVYKVHSLRTDSVVFGVAAAARPFIGGVQSPNTTYLPWNDGVYFGSTGMSITSDVPFTAVHGSDVQLNASGVWTDEHDPSPRYLGLSWEVMLDPGDIVERRLVFSLQPYESVTETPFGWVPATGTETPSASATPTPSATTCPGKFLTGSGLLGEYPFNLQENGAETTEASYGGYVVQLRQGSEESYVWSEGTLVLGNLRATRDVLAVSCVEVYVSITVENTGGEVEVFDLGFGGDLELDGLAYDIPFEWLGVDDQHEGLNFTGHFNLVSYEPPAFSTIAVDQGVRSVWVDSPRDVKKLGRFAASWQGISVDPARQHTVKVCFSVDPVVRATPTATPEGWVPATEVETPVASARATPSRSPSPSRAWCGEPNLQSEISGVGFGILRNGERTSDLAWYVFLRANGGVSGTGTIVDGVGSWQGLDIQISDAAKVCTEAEMTVLVRNTNAFGVTFDLSVTADLLLDGDVDRPEFQCIGGATPVGIYFAAQRFQITSLEPAAFTGMWVGAPTSGSPGANAFNNNYASVGTLPTADAWAGMYLGNWLPAGESKTFVIQFWQVPEITASVATATPAPTPAETPCGKPYVAWAANQGRAFNVNVFTEIGRAHV